ncbi:MAG: aminomethyl transferase family protein [Armatimonadota bacterium]|nr:aminomethyl transferase family protein [Armatimonadota bacterium]MDR7444729.1 aminomethyl transferase family protein [Armatimonadota bacterium]MDR7570886.1 aminomethyl transferase family protein [Armatimonadota bacterium]MDR7613266.1 aminomethyl transferase family protein [Armatimonadota bacterium]
MQPEGRRSLEDLLREAGYDVVSLLRRNNPARRTGSTFGEFSRVPAQVSGWFEETKAWRTTVALFDQSHHMTNLFLKGPDALSLLRWLGVNTFQNFAPGRAKQLLVCNDEGYVIRDAVLFYLEKDLFKLVARPPALNWVQFHAESGTFNVTVERDERSSFNPSGRRKLYRFQLQGPNAPKLLEKLNGGPLPEIPFFHFGSIRIGNRTAWALHHGMAGVAGMEIFGPWEEAEEVKATILEAGQEFGLREAGHRAYLVSIVETGWVPLPVPAIYTGERLRPYREWLSADSLEATGSLGGSFWGTRIEEYYLTPWDLGYGHLVKFDHDFVGKEALEEKARDPRRKKVTLVWNKEDVLQKIFRPLFEGGTRGRFIDLPLVGYATWHYDKVVSQAGTWIGFSSFGAYSANEHAILTVGVVDREFAEPGTEVVVIWGEGGRGDEEDPEVPVEIRATVGPVPFSEAARRYRASVGARPVLG